MTRHNHTGLLEEPRTSASAPADQELKDLGFGSVLGGVNERRLLNRDGTFSARRDGLPFLGSLSMYHYFLTVSWPKFLWYVVLTYVSVNVLFAFGYLACGPDALLEAFAPDSLHRFAQAFFFSVQTFGTIGYGHLAPQGMAANILVTIEALVGLLVFALGTGLLFARFSRPTASVIFSTRAVVAPYHGRTALMFRITNGRRNQLIELEAKVLFSRIEGNVRKYDQLQLERTKVVFFPLTWTIVHPIDERSPLFGMTHEELTYKEAEVLILLAGIDETFSQTVHARSSYKADELMFGYRFANIYNPVGDDGTISVNVRRLSEIEPAREGDEMAMNLTQSFAHTGHFSSFTPPRVPPRSGDS